MLEEYSFIALKVEQLKKVCASIINSDFHSDWLYLILFFKTFVNKVKNFYIEMHKALA